MSTAPAAVVSLPEPVWQVISRPRGTREHLVHAVRGSHTLCGLTRWRPTRTLSIELPRCPSCSAVPAGYATSHDLVYYCGVTYKQADHWTRSGFLKAINAGRGPGNRRAWPPEEVTVTAVMRRATDAGVEPKSAERAARNDGWLTPDVRLIFLN